MSQDIAKRYDRAIRRHQERLDAALAQWPAMVRALQTFAEGGNVPRPFVERAMREVLALLTLPILQYPSATYRPVEFWRKEPIAQVIAKCYGRMFAPNELISQADAARELNVSAMKVARWIDAGLVRAVPVFTKLPRSKPEVHHMIVREDLDRERLLVSDDHEGEARRERRSGQERRRDSVSV